MSEASQRRVFLICLLAISTSLGCGDTPGRTDDTAIVPDDGEEQGPGELVWVPPAVTVVPPTDSDPGCSAVPAAELVVEMGEGFAPDGSVEGRLRPCQVPVHRGVASAGMRLEATLTVEEGAEASIQLLRFEAHEVNGDLDPPQGRRIVREGEAVLEWIAPRTGEYGLALDSPEREADASYALEVRCVSGCDRGMTRFPIVLMHGMGGTDEFINVLEYYNGVLDEMREAGFDVYVTVVDPLASSSVRAQQLLPQMEAIRAETGARRLNLIGHSQGGIDGRALISELDYGDRAASLTTLASPHLGTPLADIAAGVLDATELGQDLVDEIGDLYGKILGRGNQSLPDSLRELGMTHMTEVFNPTHPNDPRVAYYSWNGHTCALIERECREQWNGEVVSPLLAPAYRALQLLGLPASDGLVDVASARWGEFLGELPADHLDEVGLLLDLPNDSFDHLAFFLSEGERLFAAGY